ncbi:MAG: BsuPI-related putative proteinase inhibitor [Gemmatimonadaceae bacterium]
MLSFRLLPVLAFAAAIAFACGPRSHTSEGPQRVRSVAGPGVAASLDVRQRGEDLTFGFRITNNGKKRVELVFPSGYTHDFVVLDAAGEEVWRWSMDRMFTQALRTHMLGSSETLAYEAVWTPPRNAAGEHVVVATLLSENHPLEERAGFDVR